MIKRIRAGIKITDQISGDFEIEWEAEPPIEMTPCKYYLIPVKKTGIINKEIKHQKFHTDDTNTTKFFHIREENLIESV